ncbi:TPM domain-containing protein [Sphingomonas sp. MG17]|uniref:TPM domain-containing protein n=1 Tax=Sphingomonas tagetis TaxID=2949092 RepID=A0A9X2HK58_9SPHN|nr:TPM domain-containing protein [Sphingomonas tagetis]MCP3731627.1 TPM domain-containing protein [Sphingomonas tagetis]
MARFLVALMLGVLSLGSAARAQTFPKLTGRVVDAASLLSPEQEAQLAAMSTATEKATGRQLVVATVPDLQGYPIEDYGYKLGRAWQIGQAKANNGIILIVAPNERRIRIEVGYGLEPIMTDGLSGIIIRDTITPLFKAGKMGEGIIAGASAINEQLKLPLEAAEARAKKLIDEGQRKQRSGGGGANIVTIIFWLGILLFVILPIVFGSAKGRRYRRGGGPVVIWGPGWGGSGDGGSWGGGGGDWGGGGGGFSGGGGSFGGGGASGGW